jgi:hypothetical protein
LNIEESGDPLPLSHKPAVPVLFLSNRSEISGPGDYVSQAGEAPVAPVLWSVERDGHVNVNKRERLIALGGLVAWVATGVIEGSRDITHRVDGKVSRVVFDERGALGRVVDVTHNFGNIFIGFGSSDFERLGIGPGDDFLVTIGEVSATIRFGTTFSDVPRGAWISFPTAEGDAIVAVHYGSAFEHFGASVGDAVRIERLE